MAKLVRPLYEPPEARDLSAPTASGDVGPLGSCVNGTYPYYSCVAGPDYFSTCSPTGATVDTSYCSGGSLHSRPACNHGGLATTDCWSGAHQQFGGQ